MEKTPAEKYELTLGGVRIKDCGATVVFSGEGIHHELVRLRTGGDGKLLVNCRVEDEKGHTIASIHNSKIVHVAPEYDTRSSESSWLVKHRETSQVYFEMEHIAPGKIKVNGIFWIGGMKIVASDAGLNIGGTLIHGGTFDSCGAAIGLRRTAEKTKKHRN
jgi:hypothetical protein